MRNISIGQIVILLLIFFLLFGDFNNLKKKVKKLIKNVNDYFKN